MRSVLARGMNLLSLILLLTGSVVAAEQPSIADSVIADRLAEMFQVGFARGPKAFRQVEIQYESLSKDSKYDPRIDHAYGLVLLRLMKNKEAHDQFLAATKRPGSPLLPAWEALIWSEFNSKDYNAGYDHLLEFSDLIQNSQEISSDARDDANYWIGRVMAALELALDSNKNRETWMQFDARLMEGLGEDGIDDYNRGKEDAHAQHALLEEDIRIAKEKAKKQQDENLEKRQTQIQKSLDAVKTKRDNLKKSAAEMKEMLAEQTEAYQKQMTRLEKEYGFLERRSNLLATTMAGIDQEVTILQRQRRTANANALGQIDQSISALQNQRLVYSAEFLKVTASADQVAGNARALNLERAEFLEQYQRATGEIIDAGTETDIWNERTLNQAKALKKAKASAKPPVPIAKIQAAKTFRTYFDLDLFTERNRVLASFGVDPKEK